MEFNLFLDEFRNQFIDSDVIELNSDTDFRRIESWDSLTGMSILVMIKDIYKVDINDTEFKACNTPGDIFKLILEKSNL
jgi:acyl carrier protein